MKIYFAGSIRGGRDHKETYRELVEHLKQFGDVFTEHIADINLADCGEKQISDKEIYERDVAWVEASDVIIADVSQASLGVGYEIGIAEKLGINTLCLCRKQEGRTSAMIIGNPHLTLKYYADAEEAKSIITEYLKNKKESV